MYALFDPMSLPGGVRLPYVESGDRDGTPVLMLHGLGDSQRSFEPVLPHLPSWIRAIAATQRGHGDAAKPVAGYRLEHYVGDALALLDRLRIDRAVVVGHSLGAWVAERLAIEHPGRVGGLLLTGAGFSVYEGAGHAPHREQPEHFAAELMSFVAGCRNEAVPSEAPAPTPGRRETSGAAVPA
jgi:pimeloyl-ACP methyl ester carboxylesterase